MNVQTTGSTRPRLSLPFKGASRGEPQRSPTLSGQELRRIVAEMIG